MYTRNQVGTQLWDCLSLRPCNAGSDISESWQADLWGSQGSHPVYPVAARMAIDMFDQVGVMLAMQNMAFSIRCLCVLCAYHPLNFQSLLFVSLYCSIHGTTWRELGTCAQAQLLQLECFCRLWKSHQPFPFSSELRSRSTCIHAVSE